MYVNFSRPISLDNATYNYIIFNNDGNVTTNWTLYVPKEITFTSPVSVAVLADGEKVFSSTITDSSVEPSDIDVDISGCKTFQICFSRQGKKYETDSGYVCLGNPRFYK